METELISSQLAFAYATSAVMEWLKHQKWFPLLDKEAKVLNRLFAVVASFIVAVGIHWTFDSSQGTLVITGLTLAGVGHGFIAWVQQYAFQQGSYKLLVADKTNGVPIVKIPIVLAEKEGV